MAVPSKGPGLKPNQSRKVLPAHAPKKGILKPAAPPGKKPPRSKLTLGQFLTKYRLLLAAVVLIALNAGWVAHEASLPKPPSADERAAARAEMLVQAQSAAPAEAAFKRPTHQAYQRPPSSFEFTQKAIQSFAFADASLNRFVRAGEKPFEAPGTYAVVFREAPQPRLLERWKEMGLTLGEMFGALSYLVYVPSKEAYDELNVFDVVYICPMTPTTVAEARAPPAP